MANYTFSLADLIDLIRSEINEPTARIFTSNGLGQGAGQLDNFIDMGATVCAALTLAVEFEDDVTCVGSQFAYTPDTYTAATALSPIAVESVQYVNVETTPETVVGLQKIHPEAYGHIIGTTTGQPVFYFVHYTGSLPTAYVYPAPTTAMATALHQIRIKGYAVPSEFAASGAAAAEYLPGELNMTPLYYALACVYARLGKHRLSALNMRKFIDQCNRWRIQSHRMVINVDSHDIMRIPDVTVTQQ